MGDGRGVGVRPVGDGNGDPVGDPDDLGDGDPLGDCEALGEGDGQGSPVPRILDQGKRP